MAFDIIKYFDNVGEKNMSSGDIRLAAGASLWIIQLVKETR